jgi:hypothetical protein
MILLTVTIAANSTGLQRTEDSIEIRYIRRRTVINNNI